MTVPVSEHPSKPKIGWDWWPLWMALLAVGLFWFYVVMTPVWIGIRLVARISERKAKARQG